MKCFFDVCASKYDNKRDFHVYGPSSLNSPKSNTVMFVTPEHIGEWEVLKSVDSCIVIWPTQQPIPECITEQHVFVLHHEPRLGYAEFFRDNGITYNSQPKEFDIVNGAFIASGAKIGKSTVVFPGAYIDSDVSIGEECYIGAGVKLIGSVKIGNNVIIRENTVVGSDGLTTRRDECGKVVTIPQFGGVTIEDNVQIGALSVIAKGAIDDTVIHSGCRIDNSCFISHNVQLGEDTMIVGETIMFGSSSTGEQAFISGNSTVRDGIHIGSKALVGMGSVVTKPVSDGAVVKGSPAK